MFKMRLLRQFSSIPKGTTGAPLITFNNATIYPLGETVSPYFTNLTWKLHESETWAVVGPSSSGRRVLLEVFVPLDP
jgi:ABC-type molybdenum transport system ATPase subunit/photorepair protein PhrA